jgi:hypothetical protein
VQDCASDNAWWPYFLDGQGVYRARIYAVV